MFLLFAAVSVVPIGPVNFMMGWVHHAERRYAESSFRRHAERVGRHTGINHDRLHSKIQMLFDMHFVDNVTTWTIVTNPALK